jgi:hypothetical protein
MRLPEYGDEIGRPAFFYVKMRSGMQATGKRAK